MGAINPGASPAPGANPIRSSSADGLDGGTQRWLWLMTHPNDNIEKESLQSDMNMIEPKTEQQFPFTSGCVPQITSRVLQEVLQLVLIWREPERI